MKLDIAQLEIKNKHLIQESIELKKQLIFLKIKKKTEQKINIHIIKKTQHKISQILQLHRFNQINNK
uniref:Ribosomal protein L29 n=1 Tax=Harveyella mirabilis TaxID=282355 RepID=A0A3S8UW08_9FLOR|nr:ribosomal protein L29 [Harveyella mirabilis]